MRHIFLLVTCVSVTILVSEIPMFLNTHTKKNQIRPLIQTSSRNTLHLLRKSYRLVGTVAPGHLSATLQIGFSFGFWTHSLEMDGVDPLGSNQECRIGFKTAEYLSAWQVLGNLEIAEVLRDYVASDPQRGHICLFLSSWLGISKWTQVTGFNVAYAKSTVRHRIDSLNVRNAKNASTLYAQTLVTTNS